MGMYDYIKHEANCPNCGKPLEGFQSKDGPCNLKTLKPQQVSNFYTECEKDKSEDKGGCGAWVEFNVDRVCTIKKIDIAYRMGSTMDEIKWHYVDEINADDERCY